MVFISIMLFVDKIIQIYGNFYENICVLRFYKKSLTKGKFQTESFNLE